MITGESFVYFGPEPWGGMWRNRHQLLRRVAPANTVVYVEPRPYIDELTATLHGRGLTRADLCVGGVQPVAANLWTYHTPKCAALGGPPPVRAVTHWLRRRHLLHALSQVGVRRPIPLDFHPGAIRHAVRPACPAAGLSHRR